MSDNHGQASSFATTLREAHKDFVSRPLAGVVVEASINHIVAELRGVAVGTTVEIACGEGETFEGEVVGFSGDNVQILPYSSLRGVTPGAVVRPILAGSRAPDAEDVLGDVIDAHGHSLHTRRVYPLNGFPLYASSPNPLDRMSIEQQVTTSVRVIDGILPLGRGQRMGLFAGSGVGKSTLLSQLVRGINADVVIVGLIGERGREVGEFVSDALDEQTSNRTTVVAATSDAPPLVRMRAAYMATALAEQWRSRGAHCLLLMDSLTRFARALREVALRAGESPARRGYPASVFDELPRLLERAGTSKMGAISAVYSVLVDGGDMEEPIADETRGIVDGHLVLRRSLAERGHFPAIDVLESVSRLSTAILPEDICRAGTKVRAALAELERHRDAVDLGIYERGSNPKLDAALGQRDVLEQWLRQGQKERCPLEKTYQRLQDMARELG